MYYIGIDLGGTNTAAGIVDESGKLIFKDSVPTDAIKTDNLVKNMAELCIKICDDNKISIDEIKSIGIGIPGTINSKTGTVTYSNNIKMENYPICDEFKKYIDKPIYISNDANVAALGEAVSGGAKNCDSAVIVTLGTGVGGGIILDNKIWEGYNSAGAEIGHMVIEVGGEQCTCGRKGCWEAYSSATALIRDTKKAIDKNPDSVLSKLANKNGKVDGKVVFDAAEMGDECAKEVVENYIDHLAEGIANVVNLLAPKCVLLGGGISNQKEKLLIPLREKAQKLFYGGNRVEHSKIDVTVLGNDAGIIGAAMLGK